MSTIKFDLHFCVLKPAISICTLLFLNISQKVVNVVVYKTDIVLQHVPAVIVSNTVTLFLTM